MKLVFLLTTILFSLSCCSYSQEYSYTHYDISDGLAGSTVYCITQDKDGFIWTGTETGVSRFDGTHFHSYTTVDGLPDVEILDMFGDSKGKVWMASFRPAICYYYKGKIYNQDNDSMLRRVRLRRNIEHFAEDRDGNILAQERTALHLFKTTGEVIEFDSACGHAIAGCAAISTGRNGHFLVQIGDEVYELANNRFRPLFAISFEAVSPSYIDMNSYGMIWRASRIRTSVRDFMTGKVLDFPFELIYYRHNRFTCIDSLFYYNEFSGVREYNIRSGSIRTFLPGRQVSRTFRDASGNLWFTTLDQGIYRLNSDEFRTIRLKQPGQESSSIYGIGRIGDRIVVEDNLNSVYFLRKSDMHLTRRDCILAVSKNIIIYVDSLPGGYLAASTSGIDDLSIDFQRRRYNYMGLKSLIRKNEHELVLSSAWGVTLFDINTFKITDTLWRERSTTVYLHHDTLLVGTLNGLYAIAPDRKVLFLGDTIPFLKKRISALAESPDGTLWVSSYDAGVIGYRGGRVVASFSLEQGMTSNICRAMLFYRNTLWVGTDKGLNRINLDQANYTISKYTSQDGLGSDIINTIFADGSVIYVGTPGGLSYFDLTKVDLSDECRLYLLSVENSGRERISDTSDLELPTSDKHLRVEYAGISYRSVGGLIYRYRLVGLDTAWRATKETYLEYPILPSGHYVLQVQAVNKFRTTSTILSLPFRVATPFWQTAWFFALSLTVFLSMVWLFVSLRIRYIRRRQTEKEELNRRVTEMEHLALQAQMNPHFIFNCMNSIQQYIFDQDIFAANKYIAGFSRLIRSTLQNSTKPFITLPDEISYLSGYLSLEKLRFKEKMDYLIEVDNAINDSRIIIPPMLIQPYVENSMRHGLRHKVDGTGHIWLEFKKSGDRLVITVEDNGIGRKKAGSFKTAEHIEYQSKGMSLTAERIRMINSKYTEPIFIDVIDLEDGSGRPLGTRVVMQIPFFHIMLEKEDL